MLYFADDRAKHVYFLVRVFDLARSQFSTLSVLMRSEASLEVRFIDVVLFFRDGRDRKSVV